MVNRQEIFEYVKKQYGTVPEYLWEDVYKRQDGTWSNQLGWGGRLYEQDRIYLVGNDFKIRSDTDQTNCTQHRSECIYDFHRGMFRRWKF